MPLLKDAPGFEEIRGRGIGFEKFMEDPKLLALAKKVGVTGVLRQSLRKDAEGVNLGKQWFDHIDQMFRKSNRSMHREVQDAHIYNYFKSVVKDLLPNLTSEQAEAVTDAVKAGGEFAFSRPEAGKSVVLHEIMHTLTGKEVKPYNTFFRVAEPDIKELEIEANLNFGAYPREWISKPMEFITETMTQYFLGNIRSGTKLNRLAEAVLRNSKDPEIRGLIGTTVALAMMVKMGEKNGRRDRSSTQRVGQ